MAYGIHAELARGRVRGGREWTNPQKMRTERRNKRKARDVGMS